MPPTLLVAGQRSVGTRENLSRGIIPWLDSNPATSASAGLSVSSSGFSPSTKVTRQSSQSGVERRTHSVQLMDNSMSDTVPLSLATILVGGCHTRKGAISWATCAGPINTPSVSTRGPSGLIKT